MPPRVRFDPQRIVQAGLELVRTRGMEALSARSLAGALGCSTAPLFTHFAGMDELVSAVRDEIIAAFVAAAAAPLEAAPPGADPVLAVGRGWLRFAAEEPHLYEALFLRRSDWHRRWGPVRRRLAEAMAAHPRYAGASPEARFALVGRASIVLHGLGLELWSGRLQAADEAARAALVEALLLPVLDAALVEGEPRDLHSTEPLAARSEPAESPASTAPPAPGGSSADAA